MASLGVKNSVLRQISADDVFEELKASNVIKNAYKEMLASIKEMDAYKSLRNVAMDHISSTSACKGDASTKKRKQIFEIRRMIYNIDSGISKQISERLSKEESRIAVRKAIKKLSYKKQNIIESNKKRARKSSQLQHKNHESSTSIMEEDKDIFVPLYPSLSVFSSGLSNCNSQISFICEDENGKIGKESVSFIEVDPHFHRKGQSRIYDGDIEKVSRKVRISSPITSKPVCGTIACARPSRERKPNPKYSEEGMLFMNV